MTTVREMFNEMNESEKFGCKFGLFPKWLMDKYHPNKAEIIELMRLSEALT